MQIYDINIKYWRGRYPREIDACWLHESPSKQNGEERMLEEYQQTIAENGQAFNNSLLIPTKSSNQEDSTGFSNARIKRHAPNSFRS